MSASILRKIIYLLCCLYPFGVLAITQHDPFFWDTVQLASKHAHFFYENGLKWTPLPLDIDSGHPPVFGYYLAVMWTVFGKTLPVSHWAMLPFLLGNTVLLLRMGRRLLGESLGLLFFVAVVSDPVIAGQSTLVSPDIALAFFFLLAVEAIWTGKKVWLLPSVIGLCAISMRGMMTTAALGLWLAAMNWRQYYKTPRLLFFDGLYFFPGVALAAAFLLWHQQAAGWTGFHANSPWAAAFEPVKGTGIFRNLVVLGWRWLDFGRFILWITGALLLLGWRRKPMPDTPRKLLLLLLVLVLLLSPSAVLYHNLSAHRYFLPVFLALHLVLGGLLAVSSWPRATQRRILVVFVIAMVSGNCWIYPRGISMDWDATLAYRPYHELRAEMMAYLDARGIDFTSVGSAFPNLNTGEQLMLNGDTRLMAAKDFRTNRYMLTSNVFNDFDTEDYRLLEASPWQLEKKIARNGVWIALYKWE